jgi:peroxiredoxin
MKNHRLRILIGLILGVALMCVPAWGHLDAFNQMGIVPPRVEKPAPNFSLKDLDGKTIRLDDFRGKPVLLNFWATWCKACKDELPSMQRLYKSLEKEGVEVIAVSIDRRNFDRVQSFVDEYQLTFPVLLDPDQKARKDYFILGLPTSYLIDADGKLKGYISGARAWDSPASKEVMLSLLH